MLKKDPPIDLQEVNKQVKDFLEAHPECPSDIKSFLLRPEGAQPFVNPRDKLAYIQNYNITARSHMELKRPHKVTQAKDLNDAMRISLEDHKKAQEGKIFRMSMDDWNKAWDNKEIEVIKSGEGFLMYGQQFTGEIKYKDKKYHVYAWTPLPPDKPYVDFEEIEPKTIDGYCTEGQLSSDGKSIECKDCEEAAKHAYSDATTPGFFYSKCEKHRKKG